MLEDLLSLKSNFTRRQFVVTTLTTGFAFAVQPICAQTQIVTDANGLVAGEIKIPVADGEIPAYRAMPEKGKSFPIALVAGNLRRTRTYQRHLPALCQTRLSGNRARTLRQAG